jgi:hypothetical protein
MTCHELRRYFEDPLRLDEEFRVETEHLARCAECARFVEARRALRASLRLVRESVPEPSGALDKAVLDDYREYIAGGPSPASSLPKRRSLKVAAWAVAAAAIVLVAGVFVVGRTTKTVAIRSEPTPHSFSVPQPRPIEAPSATTSRKPTPSNSVRRAPLAKPLAAPESLASAGFRSLMYCDELSCSGAMLVIRVELPPYAAPFVPASAAGTGPIVADVLVGPDGIARGIRVVE